eukprot:4072394-Pyramimonas_sp.AAC.2
MSLRSIARAIWGQGARLASTMIRSAEIAAERMRLRAGKAILIDPNDFNRETDATHAALIEGRSARAATRARAAYAEDYNWATAGAIALVMRVARPSGGSRSRGA